MRAVWFTLLSRVASALANRTANYVRFVVRSQVSESSPFTAAIHNLIGMGPHVGLEGAKTTYHAKKSKISETAVIRTRDL